MYVLSGSQIDDLYNGMQTPYSSEEFSRFILDPGCLTRKVLEHVHYHNMELCLFVRAWKDYRKGIGLKPKESLMAKLTPGYKGDNDARTSLAALADYYSKFPHGATPRWPILAFMSRTSFTLIKELSDLHQTTHLMAAKRHLDEFITLLKHKGEPLVDRNEFSDRLHVSSSSFLDECELNVIELESWLRNSKDDKADIALSQRRDLVRQKAKERMTELYASGMTWSEAEGKTQSEMWREFNSLGLACSKMNFHKLRYKK